MKFEEVLPALREGKRARRSAFKETHKAVMIADPRKYPRLDGDREHFQIFYNPSPEFEDAELTTFGQPFDTEEEAKAFLTKTKKANTLAWNKHRAYQEAVKKNKGAPVKDMEYVPQPLDKPDAFDAAEIRAGGLLSGKRLGSPYLVILDKKNVLHPWCPTHSDLLAGDWTIC